MSQIAITKILGGPRNAVFHCFIQGDGSGDLTDEVIIDPATSFETALPAKPTLTIEELTYDLYGFGAKLQFDYLATDIDVWVMSPNGAGNVCFEEYGGLKDRALGDGLGKLKLTTFELGDGCYGSFVVEARLT